MELGEANEGSPVTHQIKNEVKVVGIGPLQDPLSRASITWIFEPVLKKGPIDYETVSYIFKDMKILPDDDNYLEHQKRFGEKGYATAFANLASSPPEEEKDD